MTSSEKKTAAEPGSPASAGAGPAEYLARLVGIERQARQAESVQELQFTITNWSHRLIPYHQAVLCEPAWNGTMRVTAVSGTAAVEPNTPFVIWLSSFGRTIQDRFSGEKISCVSRDALQKTEETCIKEWQKWLPGHLLFCPLLNRSGQPFAFLLLFREQPFHPREASLLEVLADTYAHAWLALGGPQKGRKPITRLRTLVMMGLAGLAAAAFLVRVPETVLAPAEIVPKEPLFIVSPASGQIKDIGVQPYAMVTEGQLLFQLDDTETVNQLALARESLKIVKADYLRTRQQAFYDTAAKGTLDMLRLQVQEKELQVQFYSEELDRQRVYAPGKGMVIFRDTNDWIGRPVAVGERVMVLADPARPEIDIAMPVDDAINLDQGARVKLFLRTDPLHPLKGAVTRTSYKAEVHENGGMFFTLKARLDDTAEQPRIGLQGTAKVYGGSVSLFYYLFRRPLAVIRRNLGI